MPATILLATYGSRGDIDPALALARALQQEGLPPLLLLNPADCPKATALGLETLPFGPLLKIPELIRQNPHLISLWGMRAVVSRLYGPLNGALYHATLQAIRTHRPRAVLSHPLCLGSHWAARASKIPALVFHLSPLSLPSPQTLAPYPLLERLLLRLALPVALKLFNRWLKTSCNSAGIPWSRSVLREFLSSQDLALRLWDPLWNAPAEEKAMEHRPLCGFPRPLSTPPLQPELLAFLSEHPKPLVFAPGSTVVHLPGPLMGLVAEAVRRLNLPAVLLHGEQAPPPAQPHLFSCPSAPHEQLFPHAALVIHHGGIGTSAQALRSGVPSLVVPFAFDQFDNALRLRRCGAGATRSRTFLSASSLARRIERLLQDSRVHQTAARLGHTLSQSEDGALVAARAVRALLEPQETKA